MTQTPSPNPPVPRRRPRMVQSSSSRRGAEIWKWILAAPSVIALGSSVVLAAVVFTRSQAEILQEYANTAEHAMHDQNYPLAAVCYQRLLTDSPGDPANELAFAICLARLGHSGEATEILARLAPTTGVGYPPARLWVAEQILGSKNRTPQALTQAESNLLIVVEAEPTNAIAQASLATLYAEEGKWALCKSHLEQSGPYRSGLETRFQAKYPGFSP